MSRSDKINELLRQIEIGKKIQTLYTEEYKKVLEKIEALCTCSISREIMTNPAVAVTSDEVAHMYEFEYINKWWQQHNGNDPQTRNNIIQIVALEQGAQLCTAYHELTAANSKEEVCPEVRFNRHQFEISNLNEKILKLRGYILDIQNRQNTSESSFFWGSFLHYLRPFITGTPTNSHLQALFNFLNQPLHARYIISPHCDADVTEHIPPPHRSSIRFLFCRAHARDVAVDTNILGELNAVLDELRFSKDETDKALCERVAEKSEVELGYIAGKIYDILKFNRDGALLCPSLDKEAGETQIQRFETYIQKLEEQLEKELPGQANAEQIRQDWQQDKEINNLQGELNIQNTAVQLCHDKFVSLYNKIYPISIALKRIQPRKTIMLTKQLAEVVAQLDETQYIVEALQAIARRPLRDQPEVEVKVADKEVAEHWSDRLQLEALETIISMFHQPGGTAKEREDMYGSIMKSGRVPEI